MDMNSFSLKGKIAWITGASYGIGFAIAEAYAAAGATIVVLSALIFFVTLLLKSRFVR